jgi:hypothetical protein
MITGDRRTKGLEASSMSRPTYPDEGQNVPSSREDVARLFAGWMILVEGGLVLAHTAVSSVGSGVTGSDWSFALLVALTSVLTARGLWLGARWAWWVSVAFGATGLFFLLPVTAAVLFGASAEPIGTGWDILVFPLMTAVMLALVVAAWMAREGRRRGDA